MKYKTILSRGFVSLLLCLAPCVALQASTIYTASLTGAAENPAAATTGSGLATVDYDASAHTLMVDVSFADLTAGVTAAHIHCCVSPPGVIGVASPAPLFPGFPVNVTSGSYSQLFDLTLAQVSAVRSLRITAGQLPVPKRHLLPGWRMARLTLIFTASIIPAVKFADFLHLRRCRFLPRYGCLVLG